jgi:acyl-ACP thioesterase
LAVNYKKEVLLGDTVRSSIAADPENEGRFLHLISVDGENNALGMTEWK